MYAEWSWAITEIIYHKLIYVSNESPRVALATAVIFILREGLPAI